jgi:hypothetical protein
MKQAAATASGRRRSGEWGPDELEQEYRPGCSGRSHGDRAGSSQSSLEGPVLSETTGQSARLGVCFVLCLADPGFFGSALWDKASATGAALLWRVKKNLRLPCRQRFEDGSYRSRIYPSETDCRHDTGGVVVWAIEDRPPGVADMEPLSRPGDHDPQSGRRPGLRVGDPLPAEKQEENTRAEGRLKPGAPHSQGVKRRMSSAPPP